MYVIRSGRCEGAVLALLSDLGWPCECSRRARRSVATSPRTEASSTWIGMFCSRQLRSMIRAAASRNSARVTDGPPARGRGPRSGHVRRNASCSSRLHSCDVHVPPSLPLALPLLLLPTLRMPVDTSELHARLTERLIRQIPALWPPTKVLAQPAGLANKPLTSTCQQCGNAAVSSPTGAVRA